MNRVEKTKCRLCPRDCMVQNNQSERVTIKEQWGELIVPAEMMGCRQYAKTVKENPHILNLTML